MSAAPARPVLCALAVVSLCAGCAADGDDLGVPPLQPCAAAELGAGAVRIEGEAFVADGAPIVPHGVNSYPLLQHVGRERWDAVRDVFAQAIALGRPVVRTNAFMDGGDNPARIREDDGTIREQGLVALDALVADAADFGVRLLFVLTNNWPDYGGAEAVLRAVSPTDPLPKDAFWSDARAIAMQRDYIRALVGRVNENTGRAYGREPTIFGWELANEPRCVDPTYCTEQTLVQWARAMASEVRAAGAVQPIVWGGSGHRGEHGEDLDAIARDRAVDVLTVHVYARAPRELDARHEGSRGQRVAAAVRAAVPILHDRIGLARAHGMPLLVEELGYSAPETAIDRDAERAEVLRELLAVVHDAGVAALPWMIGESGRPDHDGYLIRPDDDHTLDVITCGDPADERAP